MKPSLRADLPTAQAAVRKIWTTGVSLPPVVVLIDGLIKADSAYVVMAAVLMLLGGLILSATFVLPLWWLLTKLSYRFPSRRKALLIMLPVTLALVCLPFVLLILWEGYFDRSLWYVFLVYLISIWTGVFWAYLPWRICRK